MFVSNFLLTVIGYSTSRFLLPFLSFGRIAVQEPTSDEQGFNNFGFKRISGHRLLCHTSVAGCIGLIPWLVMLMVAMFQAQVS